jgi:hypothetical protein
MINVLSTKNNLNKKIALVSVWNHNYGSLLQTFALQTFLNNINLKNEIILYKEKNEFRQFLRLTKFSFLKMKINIIYRDIIVKFLYPELNRNLQIRSEIFEKFKSSKLQFTKVINGRKHLILGAKDYNAFVLGSDQVWHPNNMGMDFFNLNFVPSTIPKIAYAPSFGVSEIPNSQLKKTKNYLYKIDYISVRERSGQKIVKLMTGKEVPIVCDPTLLVDKSIWDELKGSKIIIENRYIFCYFLGNNPEHRSFANRLKKYTNLKIVSLQQLDEFIKSDLNFGDEKPYDVGPAEFINLISNAEYVLTDSFHATIFSILYEKKFFTFNRFATKKSGSTNSRISSILNQLNLNSRRIAGNEDAEEYSKMEINYESILKEINESRSFSRQYLLNALDQSIKNN